jgi:hypothetical protein
MEAMKSKEVHMDWSDKQRRILTANGMAERWYKAEHGFAFIDQELPHHHILHGGTRAIFKRWKTEEENACINRTTSPIVGVWKRSLFYGGFEFSTDRDEYSCNVQTDNLFIDLRIPVSRDQLLMQPSSTKIQSLEDLTSEQLCIYARQHIFAGFTKMQKSTSSSNDMMYPYCASRHHCIDWNFVGTPRSRPNKWWVELCGPKMDGHDSKATVVQQWKEWAYATDPNKQHYYCELWERWDSSFSSPSAPMLCLRKDSGRDGILIVMGDHVIYCLDRCNANLQTCGSLTSLVAVVDESVQQRNDFDTARAWLSMEGGHGRWNSSQGNNDAPVGSGSWVLDHCIEFWKQDQPLFDPDDLQLISVTESSMEKCVVRWKNESWTVFDSNLSSVAALQNLLLNGPYSVC